MHVQLTGRWQQPQAAAGDASVAAASQPTRFTAAAIHVAPEHHPAPQLTSEVVGMSGPRDACPGSELPWHSVEDVKRAVFSDANPGGITVGSTYSRCSLGNTKLTRNNSLVAPLVKLPCQGVSNGVPWTFSKCEFEDFNGYADAAEAVLRRKGIDVDSYKYRVLLLPPGACSIVGMGMVGCGDSCRSWIGAGFWTQPNAMVHELGHNLFLGHAGGYDKGGAYDEYQDDSGMMGYCCQDRCPNTVHAWQLGWLKVRQLDATTLRAGRTVSLTLPSQSRSSLAGLRVLTSWAAGTDPLFVGYRTRTGGDVASPGDVVGRVHIYSSPATGGLDPRDSKYHGSLGAGQALAHRPAGVVVRVKTVGAAAATVSICRRKGRETLFSCRNKLDYDCNGLVGAADPACALLFKRAAIPA
ncbi:hypothetical protein C2E20_5453 [Micractinium conductrix]|uniref:Peptidase M11 gametolysin domain-containing protein n=1 Tax=Micractinium conductrix TaxID=554055 RepID=A0A2P6VAJ8_9CHLO|nr:hypothetical protein C2E20_5453 [Micractinium conductrix]|eukprot:PSC71071.1 hypothetical protein C2E20_5453 [Micractinium conductrix]